MANAARSSSLLDRAGDGAAGTVGRAFLLCLGFGGVQGGFGPYIACVVGAFTVVVLFAGCERESECGYGKYKNCFFHVLFDLVIKQKYSFLSNSKGIRRIVAFGNCYVFD